MKIRCIILLSLFLSTFISNEYFDNSNENIRIDILDETVNPEYYIVGPGDIFDFVMVTSNEVINQKLVVSPLGDVIIPIIGKITVDKLPLSSAFNLIVDKCKDKIKNSSIEITLAKVKNFKILVLGPENIPTGYYLADSATKLLDIFNNVMTNFQDTINMHGHMIDFKKQGSFIRLKFRKIFGKKVPKFGYVPERITIIRTFVELFISTLFFICSLKVTRYLIVFIPVKIIGPFFNYLRIKWKSISKNTKRKGLNNYKVIIK